MTPFLSVAAVLLLGIASMADPLARPESMAARADLDRAGLARFRERVAEIQLLCRHTFDLTDVDREYLEGAFTTMDRDLHGGQTLRAMRQLHEPRVLRLTRNLGDGNIRTVRHGDFMAVTFDYVHTLLMWKNNLLLNNGHLRVACTTPGERWPRRRFDSHGQPGWSLVPSVSAPEHLEWGPYIGRNQFGFRQTLSLEGSKVTLYAECSIPLDAEPPDLDITWFHLQLSSKSSLLRGCPATCVRTDGTTAVLEAPPLGVDSIKRAYGHIRSITFDTAQGRLKMTCEPDARYADGFQGMTVIFLPEACLLNIKYNPPGKSWPKGTSFAFTMTFEAE